MGEAVDSVLLQSRGDFELIVVDDGSTDGTLDYLSGIEDPRLRVIRRAHTGNPAAGRNAGIAAARAEWIAFLDSDDLWLPEKLAFQLQHLGEQPTCGWSCTGVSFIGEDGAAIPQRSGAPYRAQSGWVLEPLLTYAMTATISTLLVRRSLLEELGRFDETIIFREDYDLVLRLAARSELCALEETLTLVRDHLARSTTAQRPSELHRHHEMAFRKAKRAATTRRIRRLCARQCAAYLVAQARALSQEGEHRRALAALARAAREAPLSRGVWRAAVGCALHSVGSGARRSASA